MATERIDKSARMSQVVVHDGRVYLSGQVAADPTADIKGQTRSVLETIDGWLAKAGTSKSNVLQATVYLSDMRHFAAMNEVWEAWIDPANPPARATVGAPLAGPLYLVEIVIVAAR